MTRDGGSLDLSFWLKNFSHLPEFCSRYCHFIRENNNAQKVIIEQQQCYWTEHGPSTLSISCPIPFCLVSLCFLTPAALQILGMCSMRLWSTRFPGMFYSFAKQLFSVWLSCARHCCRHLKDIIKLNR